MAFENKKVGNWDTYASRYIASWCNVGGHFMSDQFEDWLKSEGCTDEDVHDIREMATCGKMELEQSARKYVTKQKIEEAEIPAKCERKEEVEKNTKKHLGFVSKMFYK